MHPNTHTARRGSTLALCALACAALLAGTAATAAEPDAGMPQQVQRLALCQDSWFDWKDNPARTGPFANYFQTQFKPGKDGGGALEPNAPLQLLGWTVTQVYPQSVGMGVGFSVMVKADFATTRAGVEKALGGKRMKCETSDGFTACEAKIADQKTVTVLTPDNGKAKSSLVGCFYFYEK